MEISNWFCFKTFHLKSILIEKKTKSHEFQVNRGKKRKKNTLIWKLRERKEEKKWKWRTELFFFERLSHVIKKLRNKNLKSRFWKGFGFRSTNVKVEKQQPRDTNGSWKGSEMIRTNTPSLWRQQWFRRQETYQPKLLRSQLQPHLEPLRPKLRKASEQL